MGAGIAQVAAEAGHTVVVFDAVPGLAEVAVSSVVTRLEASVARGRRTAAEVAAVTGRLTPVRNLAEIGSPGLVIEAVVEDLEVKRDLLSDVEGIVASDAILATNTSSLSVTAIAAGLARPHQVVGMHFFNPAPVMPLIEIVIGDATDPVVAEIAFATAAAWGKTPVRCASTPGFIVNRIARPFYGEGLRLLAEGVANAATIDAVVTGAGGFRMGPFSLMDLVGIDVNLAVSKSVYAQTFHDPRFAPSAVQQGLVDAGRLGRKTGRGFYDYSGDSGDDETVHSTRVASREPLPPVTVHGDLRHAIGLVDRLEHAGIAVTRADAGTGTGHLRIGPAVLVPTDGRTATALAASGEFGTAEVAVLDLVADWRTAERVALASATQASGDPAGWGALVLPVMASVVADTPGLVLMRIVAQLASVAADAVTLGVATVSDLDTAMRLGTNYPMGPLEWADRIGIAEVVTVLDNLRDHYGEERYRAAGMLRTLALAGGKLRAGEGED